MLKKIRTLFTLAAFVFYTALGDLAAQTQTAIKPPTFKEIYKDYSFIDTATLSEIVTYPQEELDKEHQRLEKEQEAEEKKIKDEKSLAEKNLKDKQKTLKDLSKAISKVEDRYKKEEIIITDNKPHKETILDRLAMANDPEYQKLKQEKDALECEMWEWQFKADNTVFQTRLEKNKIFYEIPNTQLDLLEKWPEELKKIETAKQSGTAEERRFADPENIGLRNLGVGDAADDVRILQDPQVQELIKKWREEQEKNSRVRRYVVDLVQKVARYTDLKIPIEDNNIIVSTEEDVNAMAMPGGVIVITRGLLKAAGTEAELAGVISHELGHVAARHSYRLNKKINIMGLLMQAAQIAALMATGGISSILQYYAWQYGFGFLGMAIDLKLLGISRAYELEADTLGMQYVWNAGYDPLSFMNFFETMGRDKGYIRGTSFFRTHPAFAERITNSFREYHLFTAENDYVLTTDDFMEMKARLCLDDEAERIAAQSIKVDSERPTLRRNTNREKEDLQKKCGPPPQTEKESTFCNDPALQSFKEKIQEEMTKEKGKADQPGIELKRPEPLPLI